jgi:pilus assembly protein CpaC
MYGDVMLKFKRQSGWIALASLVICVMSMPHLYVMAASEPRDVNGTVELSVGRSDLVSSPWPVTKVSVASPKIADVQVAAPDQVVVLAKSIGTTDLILWGANGQSITRTIYVHADVSKLQNDLDRLFPSASLEVGMSRDLVTVRGQFNRAEDSKLLRSYLDLVELKHLDMTSVAGVHQVLIKVRIAEASRTALRTLGVDTFYTGEDFFGGSIISDLFTFGDVNRAALGTSGALSGAVTSGTTLFAGIPGADLELFLHALEDNQYMRVLAEPSLIAVSGEEASFLAGGEFPIPVVQGSSGSDSSSITIEFKEFGIRLKFKPTVLGDGTIRLQVAPEVSQLSEIGSVQIDGFNIPSLTTRRASTTLEMHSGQTFALAGLINQVTSSQVKSTPGLGSVPVLGSLFRSVRYQQQDTELVVLATVSLVEPLSITNERPLPGDLHDAPSDWELYANGQDEGRIPAKRGEAHATWLKERGLDQLKGPGAWGEYRATPTPAPEVNPTPETNDSDTQVQEEASEMDAESEGEQEAIEEVEAPASDMQEAVEMDAPSSDIPEAVEVDASSSDVQEAVEMDAPISDAVETPEEIQAPEETK